MTSRSRKIKKVWVSDESGRSLFGWKIKEEIFAIFFILVILALANDKNVVDKVSNNIHIQIFVALLIIYCIYNRIPWSLAFILLLLISILFSDFFKNVKESVEGIFSDIKVKQIEENDPSIMKLGAHVFSWMSNDKKRSSIPKKNPKEFKSILKKVRFNEDPSQKDLSKKDLSGKDIEKDSELKDDSDEDTEVCDRVSKMFGFSDDEGLSEAETDDGTDADESENLKDSLKTFMKDNL